MADKKIDVKVTVTVLGKELTRQEAEALYRELQKALNMPTQITLPMPASPIRDPAPPRWYPPYIIGNSPCKARYTVGS